MTGDRCSESAVARRSLRAMPIYWTYDPAGLAYVSFSSEPTRGTVETSVALSGIADDEGVDALHSIVLDFDREGRLVGLEITGNAEKVLPRELLAERGEDETRYRREL